MSNTSDTTSSNALARIEGLGVLTMMGVLIAQLNRGQPGLAKRLDEDFARAVNDIVSGLPQESQKQVREVLTKGGETMLKAALNDASSRSY